MKSPRFSIARDSFLVLLIACSLMGMYTKSIAVFGLLLGILSLQTLIVLPYAIEHGKRHTAHVYTYGMHYEVMWCGALIAGLSIVQYIGFFARHDISMRYITIGTPVQVKATALVYLTILCCITMYIIQHVAKKQLLHITLYREHIWRAAGLSLLCSVFLLYWPFISVFSHSNSLSFGDWLLAFLAAVAFAGIREFQHWDRQHHPRTIHALHKRT